MALTATANESVIMNIINRLNIPSCVRLKQSFNRPNQVEKVCLKVINWIIILVLTDTTGS